jgi:hypothetical protein
MKQRTLWILVLTIVTFIGVSSCKKIVEWCHYEEYHYVNNSGHAISITAFNKIDSIWYEETYHIGINEHLSQEIELNSGSSTGIIVYSDSVMVTYGNERVSHFVIADSLSPYNILRNENYVSVQVSENRNSNTYTFTEKDYQNANDIPAEKRMPWAK